MSRLKSTKPIALTEVELEMMRILWDRGPSTVRDIQENLPLGRVLAYTSISTIVRILEQKEFVIAQKAGRGHLYAALVPREQYEALALSQLVDNVFHGEPALLVERLLSATKLSALDIDEIRQMISGK